MARFDVEYPSDHDAIPRRRLVYVPLGTLEWHERHLPFGTDAIQAEYFAAEAAARTGGAVLPPVYFGTDRELAVGDATMHGIDAKTGRLLPGSVYWLPPSLFADFVRHIVRNCRERGFDTVVGISGHGGTAQHEALQDVGRRDEAFVPITAREFPGGGDHAGRIETEIMLAIRPELVHLERLTGDLVGVLGDDPRLATREAGLDRVAAIVDYVVARVEAARGRSAAPPPVAGRDGS